MNISFIFSPYQCLHSVIDGVIYYTVVTIDTPNCTEFLDRFLVHDFSTKSVAHSSKLRSLIFVFHHLLHMLLKINHIKTNLKPFFN